jgi:hypothetical protein
MIIDFANRFSTLQAATDATGASTNVIDLTKAGDAVKDSDLYAVVRVGTALASSGLGATLKIALQTAITEAFSTPIELVAVSIAEALLTANTIVFKVKVPPGVKQYLRFYYTESGEAFTAGTIDAFLTPDVNIQ